MGKLRFVRVWRKTGKRRVVDSAPVFGLPFHTRRAEPTDGIGG